MKYSLSLHYKRKHSEFFEVLRKRYLQSFIRLWNAWSYTHKIRVKIHIFKLGNYQKSVETRSNTQKSDW